MRKVRILLFNLYSYTINVMNLTSKKSDNLFLIHNYNTVPLDLLSYCKDYIIFDCSDKPEVRENLRKNNIPFTEVPNTGHNITSYFRYFAEEYEHLPEVICLLKGNMFGRHLTEDYFAKVCARSYFTFLFLEPEGWGRFGKFAPDGTKNPETGTFLSAENVFTEPNNAWYTEIERHPKKYFDDPDDLIRFIYKNPPIPKYYSFAPGACYIVRSEQIRLHGPAFYKNLNKLMDYGKAPDFPSEAHMVERILPILFNSALEVNPWMEDEAAFVAKLPECSAYIQYKFDHRPRRFGKLRKALGLLK